MEAIKEGRLKNEMYFLNVFQKLLARYAGRTEEETGSDCFLFWHEAASLRQKKY